MIGLTQKMMFLEGLQDQIDAIRDVVSQKIDKDESLQFELGQLAAIDNVLKLYKKLYHSEY